MGLKIYGLVIAEYLFLVIDGGLGWWFRHPELGYKAPLYSRHQIDLHEVFPHFGTLLGLSEDVICIILIAMRCLKVIKTKDGQKTQICRQGWDDFMALFEVKDCIKISQTEVSLPPTRILEGGNKSTQYNNVPRQKK